MKILPFFQIIVVFLIGSFGKPIQTLATEPLDSPQSLRWVELQAGRIDSMLTDAMRSSEPIEILVRLTECYQLFDAVSLAGLYCTDVRSAAEAGRIQCDVINYRLEKDLNSKLQRAVEARKQATLMRAAAKRCLQKLGSEQPSQPFSPVELIHQEANWAEVDLMDGMATEDLHVLAQKVEVAIRTLYEVEHLAQSFSNCNTTRDLAASAIVHCQTALSAPNWLEVHRSIQLALDQVKAIQRSEVCLW
jgi:hypothetical protein